MNLDDLLDLLPDNTTGAIDASTLRQVTTSLWQEAQKSHARLDASEGMGGSTDAGFWQVYPTAGGEPSPGQFSADTADLSAASWVHFSVEDIDDNDWTDLLLAATYLVLQDPADKTNQVVLTVSAAVLNVNVVEFTVTVDSNTGSSLIVAWADALVVVGVV